jgi:hypothetical protein
MSGIVRPNIDGDVAFVSWFELQRLANFSLEWFRGRPNGAAKAIEVVGNGLKERIQALAHQARARHPRSRPSRPTGSDEMPKKQEGSGADRAIIHEWDNWAALHPDDLNSPNAAMYFFNHLQQKKPGILNFTSDDKWHTVHDWLLRNGRVKD